MSTEVTATVTAIGNSGLHDAVGSRVEWCLTLFHHPEARFVGRRVVVESGKSLQLGRDETHFGEGGLSEKRVSRKHARVWVTEGGVSSWRTWEAETVRGSSGHAQTQTLLNDGDPIGLGGILLRPIAHPPCFPPETSIFNRPGPRHWRGTETDSTGSPPSDPCSDPGEKQEQGRNWSLVPSTRRAIARAGSSR